MSGFQSDQDMKNTKREVECLKRLQELTSTFEELAQFLVQEYLLSKDELKTIRNSPEQSRLLQAKLAQLKNDRKLQLLEFEWTILPVERICITLVTDSGHREFTAEV